MKLAAELVALRFWLGLAGADEIDAWLDRYVEEVAEPHPDALELFGLPFEQQLPAFMAFVRSEFEFDPDTERGAEVANVLLGELCEAALEGRLTVPRFCDTVSRIDAKYTTPGSNAPYPRVLAELWNGCDWCDETWSLDDPDHMRELLAKYARAGSDPSA